MRFQILHESRGRVRLRAMQRSMSMRDADLLEAWIMALPGVDQVTVHERICGVTILFQGERAALYGALSRFSYEEAGEEAHVLSPHSREINRAYKEELVFQVLRHYGKKLFLPLPLRQVINTVNAIPRIWLAAKTLLQGMLTVEVLDGVAIGGVLSAAIGIHDPLRPEAKEIVSLLHEAGIGKVVMLTGDNRGTAAAIAKELNIDDYRAEVLPEDKAAFIRAEQEEGRKVIMIGDGINDAPALSLADVGVAIGSGASIAREVADVTIAAEDLRELVLLRRLSRALMNRIDRNYRFVMGFNGGLIALGAVGVLPPATSALLHNGSTLLLSMDCLTPLLPES